jgi:hypothetical protein
MASDPNNFANDNKSVIEEAKEGEPPPPVGGTPPYTGPVHYDDGEADQCRGSALRVTGGGKLLAPFARPGLF